MFFTIYVVENIFSIGGKKNGNEVQTGEMSDKKFC